MAFHDEIRKEIEAGRLKKRFTVQDLFNLPQSETGRYIIGNKTYADNTLRTITWNHSVSEDYKTMGNFVKKGREPKFYRFEGGYFELIPYR